jgi:hypothetical protein
VKVRRSERSPHERQRYAGSPFRSGRRFGQPIESFLPDIAEPVIGRAFARPVGSSRIRLLAMGGAAFLRDVLEASRILKACTGGSGSLASCLNGGLGLLEAGPLLRTETRIFKGVVEACGIGAGTDRRCREILALRLTERKAGIKSRAAFRLWARLAIITSGLTLRHLEVARRTLFQASRAGGLPRGLRHCDCDACIVGARRSRGGKKYGANRRIGEQVQSCFHDSHFILRPRLQRTG